MNWFADKLGPLPNAKSRGILNSGTQKGQQQAKSAPQSAQRSAPQPQRGTAPPPAPEPDKKKKKGWF